MECFEQLLDLIKLPMLNFSILLFFFYIMLSNTEAYILPHDTQREI